jgi:GNAT superfamily N-acetyltransferase
VIAWARYDDLGVRGLLSALAEHYAATYGAHDLGEDDPAEYAAPAGGCLVGLQDEAPVAVGCWRRHDARSCELRRFYVAPAGRGRGWSRRMLAAVLMKARASGYLRAVCATPAAGVLAGWDVDRIAPYGAHADLPGVGCYEVRLVERRLPAGVPL